MPRKPWIVMQDGRPSAVEPKGSRDRATAGEGLPAAHLPADRYVLLGVRQEYEGPAELVDMCGRRVDSQQGFAAPDHAVVGQFESLARISRPGRQGRLTGPLALRIEVPGWES